MEFRKKTINLSAFHFYNEINKAARLRFNDLQPLLKMYLNKKILLANGNFSKEFQKATPKTDYSNIMPLNTDEFVDTNDYVYAPHSLLWLNVKICFNGGNYDNKTNYYHCEQKTVMLGKLNDSGVLISIETESSIPETDIDFEKECELVNEYNKTLIRLEELNSKIKCSNY